MENVAVLQKPPFDKPISFLKLFDVRTRTALMKAINDVRENAVTVAGEIDSRLLFERYFFFLKYRSATASP